MPMSHVITFLQGYLAQHWAVLRHAQFKDPAYGVLALMEKWRPTDSVPARNGRPRDGEL